MKSRKTRGVWMDAVVWVLFGVVALLTALSFLSIWLEGRSDVHVKQTASPLQVDPRSSPEVRLQGNPHQHE